MINLDDINERIKADFGYKAPDVFQILKDAVAKTDYLNHPRIIRCIIFLTDRNFEKLKSHIQTAIYGPRDVMLWAEYENRGQGRNTKRIRDLPGDLPGPPSALQRGDPARKKNLI